MNESVANQQYYYNDTFKKLWIEYSKICDPDYQQIIYFRNHDPEKVIEQLYENFYDKLYKESVKWLRGYRNNDLP